MWIQNLGAIGELIGGTAVLISLIYLSLQVRSNASQLHFSSRQAVAEALDRAFDPIYREPGCSIWIRGLEDHAALSGPDKIVFDALMMRVLHNFQITARAHREGFVGNTQFNHTYKKFFRGLVEFPGAAKWLKEHAGFFEPELIKMLTDDA